MNPLSATDLLPKSGAAAERAHQLRETSGARLMIIGPHEELQLTRASCPVLIVRRPVRGPYRKVLLALDGSPSTRHILQAVDSLKLDAGAELSVVHAHEPPYEAMMSSVGVGPVAVTRYASASMDQAAQMISTALRQHGADPARYRLVLVDARPAYAIRRALRTLRPELLVLGTRGHGRFRRAILGSTAHEALQSADCDVLLVPDSAIRAARRQARAGQVPGPGPGDGPAAA